MVRHIRFRSFSGHASNKNLYLRVLFYSSCKHFKRAADSYRRQKIQTPQNTPLCYNSYLMSNAAFGLLWQQDPSPRWPSTNDINMNLPLHTQRARYQTFISCKTFIFIPTDKTVTDHTDNLHEESAFLTASACAVSDCFRGHHLCESWAL